MRQRKFAKRGRRTRWTREQAARTLAELNSSKMSVADFARTRKIHPKRLYRWRRDLGAQLVKTTAQPIGFAEVSLQRVRSAVASAASTGKQMEIALLDGQVVRVWPDFDERALSRLLSALRGISC